MNQCILGQGHWEELLAPKKGTVKTKSAADKFVSKSDCDIIITQSL